MFSHGRRPCHLQYDVVVDTRWVTREAHVAGFIGRRAVGITISARKGRWLMDGADVTGVADAIDLDLGFTPSTNQIVVRRLSLRIGQAGDAPAAYLRFPEMALVRLPQTYRRTGARMYCYAAPSVGYRAKLTVDGDGAIVRYPGLFTRLPPSGQRGRRDPETDGRR